MHLASWKPGLSYDQLAVELSTTEGQRVHTSNSTGDGAPVRWLIGLPGHVVLRPTSRLGTPDELRNLIDALHQA